LWPSKSFNTFRGVGVVVGITTACAFRIPVSIPLAIEDAGFNHGKLILFSTLPRDTHRIFRCGEYKICNTFILKPHSCQAIRGLAFGGKKLRFFKFPFLESAILSS
jgi:hypothetical protein